jgi:hypothetical protein
MLSRECVLGDAGVGGACVVCVCVCACVQQLLRQVLRATWSFEICMLTYADVC